jgi:hypothetical protein
MNPLKLLEREERDRYHYLKTILETEFEDMYLTFHISGLLVKEVLNLLSLCDQSHRAISCRLSLFQLTIIRFNMEERH